MCMCMEDFEGFLDELIFGGEVLEDGEEEGDVREGF